MIICICKNLSDKKIKEAAKVMSLKDMIREFGLGRQCGKCLEDAVKIKRDVNHATR